MMALFCTVPVILVAMTMAPSASAFRPPAVSFVNGINRIHSCCPRRAATGLDMYVSSAIDVSETAPRDVNSLYGWATGYGVQLADSFELASDVNGLLHDAYVVTNQYMPAESPVACVPSDLIMTGSKARIELQRARGAERALKLSDHGLFYLFLKVLREYELGEQSPWYTYLNSLPRFYGNAGSMTDFCFSCLPPYAAKQGQLEKKRLARFQNALDDIDFLSEGTKRNEELTKWAYNVVATRHRENDGGDCCLVPVIDYFNHGGVDGVDVYISFDQEMNCYAYTTRDVQPGQALRVSYGDPTNPSLLLARYGFLDESSPGTYCKWIADEPTSELYDLGYSPSRMLFYTDGSVSSEVWDVLLYQELGNVRPDEQYAFYQAHAMGDEATKQGYHNTYFELSYGALRRHVDYMLGELEELGSWQRTNPTMDVGRHPRLPLIMSHNDFVRNIFEMVRQNLDSMMG